MTKKALVKELIKIGLKEKHASIYLSLLKLGKTSPNQVSLESNIERTSTYRLLEELNEIGLTDKIIDGSRISYTPIPPDKLKIILKEREAILNSILPTLSEIQNTTSPTSQIRFYTNKRAVKEAIMQSAYTKEKVCRDFASIQNLLELVGLRFCEKYVDRRVENGVKLLALRHRVSKKETDNTPWYLSPENDRALREVRYLSKEIDFESYIKIFGDTILMIPSGIEPVAVSIENKELAHAMKIMFDLVWEGSKG